MLPTSIVRFDTERHRILKSNGLRFVLMDSVMLFESQVLYLFLVAAIVGSLTAPLIFMTCLNN